MANKPTTAAQSRNKNISANSELSMLHNQLHQLLKSKNKEASYNPSAQISTSGSQVPLYDPQFSDDFLQLPWDMQIRRTWYLHFYQSNEIIGRCVDILANLIATPIKFVSPNSDDPDKNAYVMEFFKNMFDRVEIEQRVQEVAFELILQGNAFVYLEEDYENLEYLDFEVPLQFKSVADKKKFYDKKVFGRLNPKYKGWSRLRLLPTAQCQIITHEFNDDVEIKYVSSAQIPTAGYAATSLSMMTNIVVNKRRESIPDDLSASDPNEEHDEDEASKGSTYGGRTLKTDPYRGSCVHMCARRKVGYMDYGISLMDRVLRSAMYLDKLRQIQQITADRRKTPLRIVTAEETDEVTLQGIEREIDLALVNPDYTIVTNYPIQWQEIGVADRFINLSGEYDEYKQRIAMAFGIPMALLTGEGLFSGQITAIKILLAEINMVRSEIVQRFLINSVIKPVAHKKAFIEIDKYGQEKLIYPSVRFTPSDIEDRNERIDRLYNLSSAGVISQDYVLEELGIDPLDNRMRLEAETFTVKDREWNSFINSIYSAVAQKLGEDSNIVEILSERLGVAIKEKVAKEKDKDTDLF